MFCDITTLENFYASALGQLARHYILQKLVLPQDGLQLSIGYPEPFLKDSHNHFMVMPAQQGAASNPKIPTVLAYEDHLPFQDATFRHILLVHVLESTEYTTKMLHECWRVLDAHGQITLIFPSRRGMWARSEATPFGYGRPYAARQMERLLTEHRFKVENFTRALYFPPTKLGVKCAGFCEAIGFRLFTRMGGVIIMQARKEVFSPIKPNKRILPRIDLVPAIEPMGVAATNLGCKFLYNL